MNASRWLACTVLAASTFLLSALLPACGNDDTSGRRVSLRTRVVLAEDEAAGFVTERGWTVTPRRILIGSGPLYYFDGPPPFARRQSAPSLLRVVRRFLTVGEAHAHPGHYQPGNALGQMLEPYTADLLTGPVDLPDGSGITGTYRSARFSFAQVVSGPEADALQDHAALVIGRAEKDGEEPREFAAVADHADIARSQPSAEINGCVFTETSVEGDGTVTLTVHPRVWFSLVNFDEIEAGTEDEPSSFEAGSRPRVAFAQGLAQLSAYTFSFSP